jgi:2-oxo-3-hexenedioate decarboxylase
VTALHEAIARRLLDAWDARTLLEPITASEPEFDADAAYDVLRCIETERLARGWIPVGRKIGFTNTTIWELYGVTGPMWARVWDRTVHVAAAGAAVSISLAPFVQPRIEPEVVFGLSGRIPAASSDAVELLSCVAWMAPGFEIVQCQFPGWRFAAPDSTASFGLHGALVVGARVAVTDENRAAVAAALATFELTLSRDGAVVERGSGANVLGSPALALGFLERTVARQPQFSSPAAGELITTGTLTNAYAIEPGERWESHYGALGLDGITLDLG